MEYNIVKYANIGKVKSGKRLPKGEVVSELVSNNKYIRVRDITENMLDPKDVQYITDEASEKIKNYRVKTYDIIISVVGTVGSIAEIPSELNGAYLTENCNNLLVNEKICLKKYLKHYLISKYGQEQVIANTVGSTQPKLPIYGIENFDIVLPDINIQNKIVKILDAFDSRILINNQINNNLQKLCNEYYLSLIKDKYKEISLADLMSYQGGSQPPASEFQYISSKDNVRFVQIRDFDTNSHICYIPNSNKNKICQEDDILIARYGASLGRICYGLYGAYNVALAKVLPKDDKYKELIRIVLESKEFYEYINNVGQRSAQAGFNAGDIQAYKVKIPNDDNQIIKYNHLAKECLNIRLLKNKESKRLEELRDTLLPKLINGEIDLEKINLEGI